MRRSILLAAMLAAAGIAHGGFCDAHARTAEAAVPLRYEHAELKKGVPARAPPPARPARSKKHPKPARPSRTFGYSNFAKISQTGNGLRTVVTQFGDNNRATVVQGH